MGQRYSTASKDPLDIISAALQIHLQLGMTLRFEEGKHEVPKLIGR